MGTERGSTETELTLDECSGRVSGQSDVSHLRHHRLQRAVERPAGENRHDRNVDWVPMADVRLRPPFLPPFDPAFLLSLPGSVLL